jgi:DNA repair protein RadC
MEQGELFKFPQKKTRKKKQPQEWKVVSLRECPLPEQMQLCDTPERAVAYWSAHVATDPRFNPECECFVILLLNTRKRIKGHQLISIGTMDTLLVHPREVFRIAVVASAHDLVAMHNHPSGEPEPSEADIKVTRDLIRAGQLLKVQLVDHVIVGANRHCSLRELGFFYT